MSFTLADVRKAYENIQNHIVKTPLTPAYYLGTGGRQYSFKPEGLQRVKSFKIRGALNKMMSLSDEQRRRGVGAVSSGNHGISVSYGASLLGIENAVVVVPQTAPQSKVDKIRHFGATVLQMGQNYDECHAQGMAYIEGNGLVNIDSCHDDPLVYSGQGTVALEILAQNPDVDTIVTPIGGGGLLTGVAVAAKGLKPSIRVVGVQTAACPALIKSYEDGVCYEEYPTEPSICDALVGGIGRLSYEMAKDYVDEFIAVSEESIARAVSFMAKDEKFVAEPAGCAVVAAVQDCPELVGGRNVALVITGANIDGGLLTRLLNQY